MQKEQLNRYFWLSHEIKAQERRKERLLKKLAAEPIVTDVVTGSISEFPYIEAKIKITGSTRGLIEKLDMEIDKSIEEAMDMRTEIEQFIQSIEDPQMRELLRSRFIDCKTWSKVAKANYISIDHARKKVRDFLKTIK